MNTEITLAQIQSFFHPRPLDSHKGTFGHIALVVGSAKYVGAAYLSAQAAINSGAGLVTVIAPKNIIPILATKLAEAIIVPLEDEQLVMTILARATVIAAGPGLEDSSASIFCLTHILETSSQPLIFDATAIAMIAQHPTLLSAYFEHQKRLLHPEQTLLHLTLGKRLYY